MTTLVKKAYKILAQWTNIHRDEDEKYTTDFLRSIENAENDVAEGRVLKVQSLKDLQN